MRTTPVKQFSSLEALAHAYFQDILPVSTLAKSSGAHASQWLATALGGPAVLADWVTQHAPELIEKPQLKIAIVSSADGGMEAIDDGRWFSALPSLLGNDSQKIEVHLIAPEGIVTPKTSLSGFNLPLAAPAVFRQAVDEYLSSMPGRSLDVLLLADADVLGVHAKSGAERLADAVRTGTRMLALAASPSEFLLISGLLGTLGFESPEKAMHSRFALSPDEYPAMVDNLEWGSQIWQLTANNRINGTIPGENLLDEAHRALSFVRAHTDGTGSYPDLEKLGQRVEGADSPATDGRALVVLPSDLYYDIAAEKLCFLVNGEPLSSPHLEEYAAKSALLAAYEGRTTRFSRLLWAIRVFIECIPLLPQSGNEDDAEEDEDSEGTPLRGRVCPGCGKVHTQDDRAEVCHNLIEKILDEESPEVRLKAALHSALRAVEDLSRSPNTSAQSKDELFDEDLYELLLSRGYLRGAFGMLLEEPELDTEGRDEDGWPLMVCAITEGEFKLVEELLDTGLQPTLAADNGWSVFHAIACLSPQLTNALPEELIARICAVDGDPNAEDEDGEHPLETAVFKDNWTAFEHLMKAGASLSGLRFKADAVLERMRSQGADAVAARIETLLAAKRQSKPTNGETSDA